MPERPPLFFPRPEVTGKSKFPGGAPRLKLPSHVSQWKKLEPQFSQLREAVRTRNIEIQQSATGIDPEQALVMEIAGSVGAFAQAVKHIDGLEWLGEFELDEISQDLDVTDDADSAESGNRRLYMVMTNQKALDEILKMWHQYAKQKDPNQKFKTGLTKFRDIFLRLKEIRRWGVKDRLWETGVLDAWREDVKGEGNSVVRFEVELWYRNSEEKRRESSASISNLIRQLGGQVLSECQHDGIAYHGILAELPLKAIQEIVEHQDTELVKCDSVMFFRPSGQMLADYGPLENEVICAKSHEQPLPVGEPVIAILDGLPLANHQLLRGRLLIDDPDSVESSYEANERVHGTSMASLVVHGDLNDGQKALGRPVYVRPIMHPDPKSFYKPRIEKVSDDILFVDLIHRAVKRLFESDGTEAPVAPSIRVINFSIGDLHRPFFYSMSPVARLLDWLSFTYNVLFIISTGNYVDNIHLGISNTKFESLKPEDKQSEVVKALYADTRNRKILSPAESINGLTVGSVQYDSSHFEENGNRRFNPFVSLLPSPISAFGGGYHRAIKPDIVFTGGRALYQEKSQILSQDGDNCVLRIVTASTHSNPPGNRTASPSLQSGNLEGLSYSCGTSNATALLSHAAGICYESLQKLLSEQETNIDTRACETALLKAMLVHGCTWGDGGAIIGNILRSSQNRRQISGLISKWMGYGIPRIDRVLECTEQRATLFGFGQLPHGQAHVFTLPLPRPFESSTEKRRLTVTMAWLSPISAGTQKYRTASLWFEVGGVKLAKERKESSGGSDGWRAVRRGTVQHEIYEGQVAVPPNDEDSSKDDYSIQIKVNCREDAGKIQSPVAYGLVVSLEVAEGVNIAIYDDIRMRISPAIKIRQTTELGER